MPAARRDRSGRPRARPRPRAPRGSLSREALVRTALDLTRGEDAPPLTIQRLADAMRTRPMSLYTHIENREDLVGAVADLALREWTVELPAGAPWPEQVRAWCVSLRDAIRQYPSLVWDIARGGKFQPAMVEKVALLSRSFREAGFAGREVAALLRWIPQTALGAVVLELGRPDDLQSGDDEAAAIFASLGSVSPEARRELAHVLPYFADTGLDDLFAYTIDRMIDGIAAVAAANEKESR